VPRSTEMPEIDRGWAGGTYHVGAILDGLLGVEGVVLPGDALADHAGALVDEHRWRRRSLARGEGKKQWTPACAMRGEWRPWRRTGGSDGDAFSSLPHSI
jgi:hypothetical protein